MSRGFIYAVIGALVVVGAVFAAGPIQRRFTELRADRALISGDTGDVMASATYQRFKASREAIAAMREDLHRLARAESAFIADSGRPTAYVPEYALRGRGNIGPTIQIMHDRWIGTLTNSYTTAQCQVTGMLDTAGRQQGPADVHCLGVAAVESAWAVAQREEASRAAPPAPGALEVDRQSAPPPPPTPLTPQKHRDWGPINNAPPPIPWIVKNVCPGEYCSLGRWAACSTVTVYQGKSTRQTAYTIRRGDEFTALTGDVHVDRAGIVRFRDTVSNNADEANGVDSIQFIPADTLYLLDDQGEGYLNWWYRGRAAPGYAFWGDDPRVVLVRSSTSTWWVHVRNAAGREGWIQYDWRKMARDDRMDEISRCKQP